MPDSCHSPSDSADHSAVLSRLNRIEGQVRGVRGMIEDDRYCIDILTQISAVKSALSAVEREVLKAHADHCVANAISSGNHHDQAEKLEELIALLFRATR